MTATGESMERPSIGVVIPVRNGFATLPACLDAVLAAARRWPGIIPVVVVDNGSTDGTVELVRRRYADHVVLLEEPERTVGGLRNLGAASLQTDLLSFVDADCVIAEAYFDTAWKALRATGAAGVGAPYALPPNPGWIERTWDAMHQRPTPGPAEWLYAGNMIIRAKAFWDVGGFPESLPTGEDPELGKRLRRAGHALHIEPALVAVHLGNPRSLGAFFRQQWWHGLGALPRGGVLRENRPLLMTLAHLMLGIGWVAALVCGVFQVAAAAAGGLVLSQALVPLLTVAFRVGQTRQSVNVPRALLLYWLYYAARLVALASVTIGFPRSPRDRS